MNCRQLSRLTDSQETASIKEARKLLVEKAGMTDEQADKWVRGDLRAAFPILRDKKAAKFILGTTRLFVEQQLNDADAQNKLTRVLKEINEAHYDEFDRNLNGKSLQDLYSPFEQTFKEADRVTRESSSSKQFGKSDYKIYGPYDSFEDAEEAWGNNSQTWCVFHDEDAYGNYTSAGQRFYVAAQDGWKSIPKEVGDYAPKDAYGNSLIAISVDLEGNLATSTPRWNHANGGGDHTYTVDELEGILQMPFYDTFKPYSDEERRARGIMSFEEAAERLASGEDPHRIFNNISPFREGFAAVRLNGKWNFIDTNNNLLSDQWFDDADYFHDGFACVRLNGKYNFMDTKGNFLSDQWFDYVNAFREGFAYVQLNNKCNFLDTKGNFLSDQWFNDVGLFREGFAAVRVNREMNYIDTKGNFLSDQWFDYAMPFKEGFAEVRLNGKRHHIDKSGKIVDSKKMYNLNCKKLLKHIK